MTRGVSDWPSRKWTKLLIMVKGEPISNSKVNSRQGVGYFCFIVVSATWRLGFNRVTHDAWFLFNDITNAVLKKKGKQEKNKRDNQRDVTALLDYGCSSCVYQPVDRLFLYNRYGCFLKGMAVNQTRLFLTDNAAF